MTGRKYERPKQNYMLSEKCPKEIKKLFPGLKRYKRCSKADIGSY